MLFAALPINSMDGILPNTLSDSVTGGGLFDIVDIKSGSMVNYPVSFDIAAILSISFRDGYPWLLSSPYWFLKPLERIPLAFPYALYSSNSMTPSSGTLYIDTTYVGGGHTNMCTVIFYKKRT